MRTASTRRSDTVSAARGSRRGGRATTGPSTPKRPSARAARLAALIAELENAAEAVGVRVRRERLMREVGYHARSGLCRVDGEEILFVDHDLTPDDEIELLALTLSGRDLSAVEMSPEARRLLVHAPSGDEVDKHQPRP
jgi:hypothetical protein